LVHHLGIEDRLPDRLPDLPSFPDHRPGRLLDPDVARHDDALSDDRIHAVQAVALRHGRRLDPDHGVARGLLPGRLARWTAIISSASRSRRSGSWRWLLRRS